MKKCERTYVVSNRSVDSGARLQASPAKSRPGHCLTPLFSDSPRCESSQVLLACQPLQKGKTESTSPFEPCLDSSGASSTPGVGISMGRNEDFNVESS
jgi:hypothetical protein